MFCHIVKSVLNFIILTSSRVLITIILGHGGVNQLDGLFKIKCFVILLNLF